MLNLKSKWENLINKKTGVEANVTLFGDSKIHVFVSGDEAFDVFNFFMFYDKTLDIVEDGFVVTL